MIGLFDREGHLAELGLHQIVAEELEGEARGRAEAHLGSCPACAARLDALRGEANRPLPPLRLPVRAEGANNQPAPAHPRRSPWWIAGAVAAAAVAGVVVWPDAPPPVPPETFQSRGAALRLEAWRSTHDSIDPLQDNHLVGAGDRIGFRVANTKSGYLLVIGLDGAGTVYPVWPPEAEPARQTPAQPLGAQLDMSLVLDPTPGTEHIVALLCPSAPARDQVAARLQTPRPDPEQTLPPLLPDCDQAEVRLRKIAEKTP